MNSLEGRDKNPEASGSRDAEFKRVSSPSSAADIIELDANVWRYLPEVILDRIAACLPLPTLFRFRGVCRRWNNNLECSNFLKASTELTRCRGPHFLMLVERSLGMLALVFDLIFHKWYRIPFTGLKIPAKYDIVAASEGLVCLKDRETNLLSVCNPITNLWRELPPLLSIKSAFEAGMMMEGNGKDYNIIVWRDELPAPITEVYSSKCDRWELKSSIEITGDVLSDSSVVCGSVFYILVIYESLSVFAYTILEDSWSEVQAAMPQDILYGYLLNHWENLLMVGGIGKDFPTKGIAIWRLEQSRTAWTKVLVMPGHLFNRLTTNFHHYDAFNCAGLGDHICFVADRYSQALIYDFAKMAWLWSPAFLTGNNHQIAALELRLDAVPFS